MSSNVPGSLQDLYSAAFVDKAEAVIAAARRGAGQGVLQAMKELVGLSAAVLADKGPPKGRIGRLRRRLEAVTSGQ